MTKPPVIIVPYDPQWPRLFHAESELIRKQIGSYLEALEHVGSTAAPGLGAKPIIDIMPGLRQPSDGRGCIEPLADIGYEYVRGYENWLPERRYNRKALRKGGHTTCTWWKLPPRSGTAISSSMTTWGPNAETAETAEA
ncbi:MAG: GrpB family protein [Candidatus Thermoplasmatota archaeon]|nr:GrpB family protein [Candidatus Thermoplasmatota archaeon]